MAFSATSSEPYETTFTIINNKNWNYVNITNLLMIVNLNFYSQTHQHIRHFIKLNE